MNPQAASLLSAGRIEPPVAWSGRDYAAERSRTFRPRDSEIAELG